MSTNYLKLEYYDIHNKINRNAYEQWCELSQFNEITIAFNMVIEILFKKQVKPQSWRENEKQQQQKRMVVDGYNIESLFILQLPTSCHVFIVRGFRYWLIRRIYIALVKSSNKKGKESLELELRDEISAQSLIMWYEYMKYI